MTVSAVASAKRRAKYIKSALAISTGSMFSKFESERVSLSTLQIYANISILLFTLCPPI